VYGDYGVKHAVKTAVAALAAGRAKRKHKTYPPKHKKQEQVVDLPLRLPT